jgi:hypothetical protein
MRKFLLLAATALALICALASQAAASAKWLTYPACSATATTLTCTGTAAGLNYAKPDSWPGRPPWSAMVFTQATYTCDENPAVTGWAPEPWQPAVWGPIVQNGIPFIVSWSPPSVPVDSEPSLDPAIDCPSGNWTRDPNYAWVDVAVGQNEFVFGLYANLGPIYAQ